ncbi:MAG: sigma-70 family RNA polymerase sigma factor [Elusimicrobia bacterium]|nr:sigma-70 family RNA polymerase sigma factor [Candidatus Liberimonas magnetica]
MASKSKKKSKLNKVNTCDMKSPGSCRGMPGLRSHKGYYGGVGNTDDVAVGRVIKGDSGSCRRVSTEDKLIIDNIKLGDENARDILITKHSSLVISLARKYHNCFKNIDMEELIAEGNSGLLESINYYNPSLKTKFSTYAWFWIVKNMQEYINKSNAIIGLPYKVMSDLKRIVGSMEDEVRKGNVPSLEDISKKLDFDLDKVKELLSQRKNLSKPLSLDKYLDNYEKEATLGDIVPDESSDTIVEILDKSENKISLDEMLEHLTPIEAEIIKLRYGFNDKKYHSLKDMSKKVNISANKIKDIESIAIRKLKKLVEESSD